MASPQQVEAPGEKSGVRALERYRCGQPWVHQSSIWAGNRLYAGPRVAGVVKIIVQSSSFLWSMKRMVRQQGVLKQFWQRRPQAESPASQMSECCATLTRFVHLMNGCVQAKLAPQTHKPKSTTNYPSLSRIHQHVSIGRETNEHL